MDRLYEQCNWKKITRIGMNRFLNQDTCCALVVDTIIAVDTKNDGVCRKRSRPQNAYGRLDPAWIYEWTKQKLLPCGRGDDLKIYRVALE